MIKVTVKRAARKRGIRTAYRLGHLLQATTGKKIGACLMIANELWKGRSARLNTLDEVAAALGDCDLSELLVRVPDKHTKPRSQRRASMHRLNGSNGNSANVQPEEREHDRR